MFKVSLLGNPTLFVNNERISHAATKSVFALLAYLTEETHSRIFHSREKLAEMLWPGMPPGSGRKNLRQSLYELNKLLPVAEEIPVILGNRQSIQWNTDIPVEIDTHTFEQLLQLPGVENLRQAVGLYQGDFLGDFYLPDSAEFENWAQNRREHYRRRFREALRSLIALNPPQVEDYARRLSDTDPLDEEAARVLMRILTQKNARTEALQRFETLRRDLREELGVDPDPQTLALYEQISQGKLEGTRTPPAVSPPPTPKNIYHLPGTPTPFIGRRSEVEEVKALVQSPAQRLVTLLGAGGTGKTRLSIQAASELTPLFQDGVVFVSLAPVQSTEGVGPAIIRELTLSSAGGESPLGQLSNFLREKHLLLVLDNFEHLIDGAAIVSELLAEAPGLKILVTSRIRLNIRGEQLFQVGGMNIPTAAMIVDWDDPQEQAKPFGALQLFVDRAQRVQPDFHFTKENVLLVVEICQLVEGLPLGIELAAAWLEILPLEEIIKEIRRSLDFLSTDLQDVPEHQRSIRAVFDSSWAMLNETERNAFARFSVFRGNFSREAAMFVCEASLRTLLGLANKSWLQQSEEGRFQLHELLRQYGYERLISNERAAQDARDLHAEYYADFVYRQGNRLKTREQVAALEAIAKDFDSNIHAAWDWLVKQEQFGVLVEKMCFGLYTYTCIRRVNKKTSDLLEQARKGIENSQELEVRGNLLKWCILSIVKVLVEFNAAIFDYQPAELITRIWEYTHTQDLASDMGFWHTGLIYMYSENISHEAGMRLFQETLPEIRSTGDLYFLGWALLAATNYVGEWRPENAEELLLEALPIFQQLGVPQEQGITLSLLGDMEVNKKNPEEAVRKKKSALEFFHQTGDPIAHSQLLAAIAKQQLYAGNLKETFQAFLEQRAACERLGNRRVIGFCYSEESEVALRYSTIEHALETRFASIKFSKEVGIQADIAWHTWELGEIFRVSGDFIKASQYYEEAYTLFKQVDHFLGIGFYHRGYGDIAHSEGNFIEAKNRFAQYLRHAEETTHLWSVGYAKNGLGRAALGLEDFDTAHQIFPEAIWYAEKWNCPDLACPAVLGLARLFAIEGDTIRGLELTSLVASHYLTWNEVKNHARTQLEHLSKGLPRETVQSAIERGKMLELTAVFDQLTTVPKKILGKE